MLGSSGSTQHCEAAAASKRGKGEGEGEGEEEEEEGRSRRRRRRLWYLFDEQVVGVAVVVALIALMVYYIAQEWRQY